METDILKYIAFGYSFTVGLISVSFADDLRNPQFFKRCLNAGIFSFAFGIIFEFTGTFNLENGMTLLFMSVPLIYLGHFEALRRVFRKWKGVDPYITSASSTIGGTPTDGFWTKYPKNRKIMWADFLFSFAQFILPVFSFVMIMILITNN